MVIAHFSHLLWMENPERFAGMIDPSAFCPYLKSILDRAQGDGD
jgi:hypothetical protein